MLHCLRLCYMSIDGRTLAWVPYLVVCQRLTSHFILSIMLSCLLFRLALNLPDIRLWPEFKNTAVWYLALPSTLSWGSTSRAYLGLSTIHCWWLAKLFSRVFVCQQLACCLSMAPEPLISKRSKHNGKVKSEKVGALALNKRWTWWRIVLKEPNYLRFWNYPSHSQWSSMLCYCICSSATCFALLIDKTWEMRWQ
jgi:hypothetical protein